MTEQKLTRGYLEALLIARTLESGWVTRADIRRRIDRTRFSPAAWGILVQITDGTFGLGVQSESDKQDLICERVDQITIADLHRFELDTLLLLVNNLPARPRLEHAWERDLARASEAVA